MTDGWDERTEAIPGTKGDKSFELDFDFAPDEEQPAPEPTEMVDRPSVVVFEPAPLGLAQALGAFGLAVRVGTTGVDVMSLVSSQPPAVVICAPSPDAERRRLLAAALRLRFPSVPVIYVSTHARQEEAVLGAIREGARAVLAWPLPGAADVHRVLGPYLRIAAQETVPMARQPPRAPPGPPRVPTFVPLQATPPAPSRPRGKVIVPDESSAESATIPHERARGPEADTGSGPRWSGPITAPPRTPASIDDVSFEEAQTVVMGPPPKTQRSVPHDDPEERLPSDAMRPLPVPLPVPGIGASLIAQSPDDDSDDHGIEDRGTDEHGVRHGGSHGVSHGVNHGVNHGVDDHGVDEFERELSEPTTQPNLRPAAGAVLEAMKEKRGEIGQLLAAVSPFLWSLEDAARWAEELGESGDAVARNHARTLQLLAKILAQLQARIDELGA